jgi:hypothetical protein
VEVILLFRSVIVVITGKERVADVGLRRATGRGHKEGKGKEESWCETHDG